MVFDSENANYVPEKFSEAEDFEQVIDILVNHEETCDIPVENTNGSDLSEVEISTSEKENQQVDVNNQDLAENY